MKALLLIPALPLLLFGCSDDPADKAIADAGGADSGAQVERGGDARDRLNIQVAEPDFDREKGQPEVALPAPKGSSLDF